MNRNYKIKVNIIAVITMIIMLSGCFIFNSNATEVNTLPPPVTGDDTNTSTPEPPSDTNTTPGDGNTSSDNENTGSGTGNGDSSGDSTDTSNGGNNGGSTSNGNSGSSSGSSNSRRTTTSSSQSESSNANLINLGIRPHDFSGFRSNTTSYSVTVPADTESVEVYAEAQDSSATVTGTGTVSLQEGENTINVVVTAENGTTKTYTIIITREAAENTEENTEIIEGEGLASLSIQNLELSPKFETNVYEYTAKYIGEDTALQIEANPTNEEYQVEIVGNEELKEGENLITILVSDSDGNNVATYQITVNKSLVDEEALAREQAEQEQRQRMIIGAVIAVVVVIAIIVFIIIRRRRNRAFAEEYSGVPFYGMNKDDNDNKDDMEIDDYGENFEEKPKALRKKKKFIEDDDEDTKENNYENDDDNLDDDYNDEEYENEEEQYEKENQKIMSRLQDDEEEIARRERVRAKFLDGYSKNMQNKENNNTTRKYNKFDDEDDLNDKAEAFASRVKRNSKGRRFKE